MDRAAESWSQLLAGVWLALLLIPVMAAARGADDYFSEAQALYRQGNYPVAMIQLKNAVQSEPDNAEARLLLGKTYLQLEKGAPAVKELKRSLELGAGREEAFLHLGQAYLMTGQYAVLLDDITVDEADTTSTRAAIALVRGKAYLQQHRFEQADESFDRLLELRPADAGGLAGKARVAFNERDTVLAAQYADQAIAADDATLDAWIVRAELERTAGRYGDAIAAFDRALEIEPSNVPAALGRAMCLVAQQDNETALAELGKLLETDPGQFMAHYLRAVAFYHGEQFKPAQDAVQNALKLAPEHLPSLRLGGVLAYQLGQLNQAEYYLRKYTDKQPGDRQIVKLLAATLLGQKKAAAAVELLEPGVEAAADDAQYLSLLGAAWLGRDDPGKGLEYLRQAIDLAPDSVRIRTQLALGYLALGEEQQAIGELSSAVELDQQLLQADLLLVLAYLRSEEFDSALSAVEALRDKMPDDPIPDNLAGSALQGKGDYQGARQAYNAALTLRRDFVPAHLNLARLELLEGNEQAAETRYLKVLSHDEDNRTALLALASIADHQKKPTEAERWLKRAYRQYPQSSRIALILIGHYQRNGQLLEALDTARSAAVKHPSDPQVLQVLAQVQIQAGQEKDALATMDSLLQVAPQSADAWYQRATIELRLKHAADARKSLEKALSLRPDFPAAQMALGRLAISDRDFESLAGLVAQLQRSHPDAAYAHELQGDSHYARQQFDEAARAYARAAAIDNNAGLAAKRFEMLNKSGRSADALKVLRQWLEIDPQDTGIRSMLAITLQSRGDGEEAIAEYEKLLAQEPDNVTAMNNLAWLYYEAGHPDAVRLAERAHTLAPSRPDVTDTLGWLLVNSGQVNRGLVLLQEASVKAPHIAEIRYHMIVAMDRAGRRNEARQELNRLLGSGRSFDSMEDARRLQESWGG